MGPANAVYNFTRSPLIHWEEDFNRLFAGLPARRPLPYRIWGDTMAFQGTINPTNTPVLQVNSAVPLYWKARSYPTYTHEGWLSEGTVLKEPGWQPEYSIPDPEQERFNVTFEVIPRYDSRSLFARRPDRRREPRHSHRNLRLPPLRDQSPVGRCNRRPAHAVAPGCSRSALGSSNGSLRL